MKVKYLIRRIIGGHNGKERKQYLIEHSNGCTEWTNDRKTATRYKRRNALELARWFRELGIALDNGKPTIYYKAVKVRQ